VRGLSPVGYTKKASGSMPEAFSYHPVRKMGLEECYHSKNPVKSKLPVSKK
jgi:hypothetical protein